MSDASPPPRSDWSTTYEIGLLGLVALGVMMLVGVGLYGASKRSQPFDPSAYLVVLTLIVGAIKERWLSRSVDRMGQKLGESQPVEPPAAGTTTTTTTVEPTADAGAPAGTEAEPLIVAGAPEGHRPVSTKGAKP